ncbi:hypothetical protein D8S78_00465 [Natrialba swarupiae]|nr:hypothetical protein [Natrialba swarupiae]
MLIRGEQPVRTRLEVTRGTSERSERVGWEAVEILAASVSSVLRRSHVEIDHPSIVHQYPSPR